MEELADVSANFHLYYGHEISRMIEWEQVLEMRLGGEEQTRFKMSGRTDKYQVGYDRLWHKNSVFDVKVDIYYPLVP